MLRIGSEWLSLTLLQSPLEGQKRLLVKAAVSCSATVPSNPRSAEIVCHEKLVSERRHRRRKRRFAVGKTVFSLRNYGLCA